MYKYIKGKTITSEERLYTAVEVAIENNCYMLMAGKLMPNGILIAYLIDKFIEDFNYKTYEYYFITIDSTVYRVYQSELIQNALKPFKKFIEDNQIKSDSDNVYNYDNIPFVYYEEQDEQSDSKKVIDLSEYRDKKKEKKLKGGNE